MSYSVIILDDEPLIVSGIAKAIKWEEEGCRLVATGADGLSGKKLLDKYKPDIVISDIVMPDYTGLELAKYSREKSYKSKFILLSAFGDFHYAQEAISYKVNDYIVKPIDVPQLLTAIRKAVRELSANKSKENQRTFYQGGTQLSTHLLFDIARHGYMPNGEKAGSQIKTEPGVVVSVCFYNVPKPRGENYLPVFQGEFIEHFIKKNYSITRGGSDSQIIFLCDLTKGIDFGTSRNRIIQELEQIAKKTAVKHSVICTAVVSKSYTTPKELHEAYKENQTILEEGYFESSTVVMTNQTEKNEKKENTSNYINDITHHLSNANRKAVEETYQQLCGILLKQRSFVNAKHTFRELHWQATNLASRAGMLKKPDMKDEFINQNFFNDKKKILDYLLAICDYISAGRNIIGRLEIMIEVNYSKTDFGLAQAADTLELSSSYLSRMFKEKMGRNFVDYLLGVRLAKAKELLVETNSNIEEIANKVGFINHNYFGQVFKKETGLTPKQYREAEKNKEKAKNHNFL